MSVNERARHRLFQRLEEVLGPEEAGVLMEHLPPVGWADVATKHDLETLAALTRRDLETMEHRLTAQFRRELSEQARSIMTTVVVANVGSVLTVGGLAFAACRLA